MKTGQNINEFFINIATNLFMVVDAHGQILEASDKARYAFSQNVLVGTNLLNYWPQEYRRTITNALLNVAHRYYPETLRLEFRNRFYNLFLYPFDGAVAACFEDITEQHLLSHQLNQSRLRLDFAEKTAKIGYWELDLATRRFFWSQEMFRIFGLEEAPKSGKHNLIRENILPQDMPIYKQQLKQLISTKQPVEGRVRLRRSNGEIVYCLFRAAIRHDMPQERIAGTFQDISASVLAQQELEAAKQRADEASRAKTYFLAQASHDLRQPMQALQLFIETLMEEKLTKAQQKIVKKIAAASGNLQSLLENLLDITKLDSGGIRLECQTFDLGTIFCRLCMEYHQTAATRNINIICRVRHFSLSSDPVLIERIIRNLFSNALKYSKNKILLSCSREQNRAVIRVIDNGPGISDAEIERIFDEFYQSTAIENNRSQGAGLGLSIVKRIAGLLNGQIRVRSLPGAYTAFEISFPLNADCPANSQQFLQSCPHMDNIH